MPTENRSSNTELNKIVTEALVAMVSAVTGTRPPVDTPLPDFIQAPIDRAVERIAVLLPPTSDGFSTEQMSVQGADGYRNGIKAAAELVEAYPELAQAIRDLPLPQ
ncbi:hypothetical protein ACIKP7_01540 [Pseudomonas caricapapayae]|uniref:Uncharacterized protein n=1 Tax=Pseudomonas caricapapayae TaxID=46678 RepID=A0ACC7LP05_9PSED